MDYKESWMPCHSELINVIMKKHVSLSILFLLVMASVSIAQQANLSNSTTPIAMGEPPVDGYLLKSNFEDRKVMEYSTIRPEDIAFVTRIWQEFDLREPDNSQFKSPRSNLMQIIMDAVLAGELTAYDPTPSPEDPTGDSFKVILPADQVLGRFGGDSTLVEQYDEYGNVIASHFEAAAFNPEDVVRFRIKEDWIFDKNRSVFEVRIVGIAPLISPNTGDSFTNEFADGEAGFPQDFPNSAPTLNVDPFPAFWIYFPEARHILVHHEAPSLHNSANGFSYDDVFTRRLFSSYIIKEDRPDGMRIKDYKDNGMERLTEAEWIKQRLVDFEQGRWSY